MSDRDLYDVLDFVLNRANSAELDAIRAALRKREAGKTDAPGPAGTGALGVDVRELARSTAEQIEQQVGASRDQVRDMVQRMVRRVVAREAPELSEAQTNELLNEWAPGWDPEGDSDSISGSGPSGASPSTSTAVPDEDSGRAPGSTLPAEALLSMVRQFVAYSTGVMPVHEEMELTEQIPGWQRRYWERFPQVVRRLVALFVKGTIGGEEFWRGMDDALGIDTGSE